MSSLATAHSAAAPGTPRAAHQTRALRFSARTDLAVGLALAAALTLLAFVAGAGDVTGTQLGSNTWVELVLLLCGAGLVLAVLIGGAPGRAWGAATVLLFAALAAFTALSIAWSVQPENSWLEANRTLSYLAVFAGAAALARLFPARWPGVIGGVAVATTVICGYALLVKVFPETFDPGGTLGRIYLPTGYWNAVGLIGALGTPASLWAGARTERARAIRALAVPSVAVLVTVVILSYSRSALLALIVGVACWFAVVPLRLRGALVLGIGLAGAAVLAGWALATGSLTDNGVALGARTTAGHAYGIVLFVVLAGLAGAGLLAAYLMDRTVLAPELRRRVATGLVALVALVPLAGIAGLAASSRGLTGEISHAWSSLTTQRESVTDTKVRLGNLESSRARDWSEGLKVADHHLLAGAGAGGYGTARTRYTTDVFSVQHAHSYVIETLADLGVLGLALNLAVLVAWGLAAARTVAVRPRDVPAACAPERAGMLTLLCVVIVFGTHSAIDWTWFVPGAAGLALLCAGWLAGRGPLAAPVGRLLHRRRLTASPGLGAVAIAIVGLTLLGGWAVWQPLRSADAYNSAIAALTRGDTRAAFGDARAAAAQDPLSVNPLWALSAAYSAVGDRRSAQAELVKATQLQPQNPDTWLALGSYVLNEQHDPARALPVLEKARSLDLSSTEAKQWIATAQTELKAGSGS